MEGIRLRPRAVRLTMLILPSLIVLASVAATAGIAVTVQAQSIRAMTAERVQSVAASLAELSEVQETLEKNVDAGSENELANAVDLSEATTTLQPLADLVERAAGVFYVVITDDEGVRITHPRASERGVIVSTTNASVLAGEDFLGTETGASGASLRAKVPVRSEHGTVIGMVAVGVLESSISAEREEASGNLVPWILGALVVATVVGSLLAVATERRFRRLDREAAAHENLRRTAAALREQSHEFNTHLHVIHGLVSHGDSADALHYVDSIVPVLTATKDRDLSSPVLLWATMDALRSELTVLGVHLEIDFEPDIETDEAMVLVLANLCRNAGEAGASRVRCILRTSEGRVIGAVEDDGPGIDPRDSEQVFERGHSSKQDPTGVGRGIGLDLVRRTIVSRGGTIEVARSPWGGARFTFEMAVTS
ncbi:ATP-binding protein [Microbacterium sp. NPDC076768]|uniref:sensor histidine kinase n=1 Tax=Microbacterium sp. NPDC076768 TaxID=3154858 RepID=UPI00341F11DD